MRKSFLFSLLALSLQAFAQHSIDFEVSTTTGDGRVVTTATWSATPPAESCEATGAPEWAGPKAASGSQVLTLTQSVTLNLSCTWPGSSIATLSWVNPQTNEDGSSYTDRQATVIRYARDADPVGPTESGARLEELLTLPPGVGSGVEQLDPTWTMHTITGLVQPGEWRFVAYACNELDICSRPSNVASKVIVGMMTVTESVGITVNPIPGPITELVVQ